LLNAGEFDVIFHGLPETRFDKAGIATALQSIAKNGVSFAVLPF
jgi:hypothetical protein